MAASSSSSAPASSSSSSSSSSSALELELELFFQGEVADVLLDYVCLGGRTEMEVCRYWMLDSSAAGGAAAATLAGLHVAAGSLNASLAMLQCMGYRRGLAAIHCIPCIP